MRTLGDLADQVRSKNAGPFWLTLEAFLPDDESYQIADAAITAEAIAGLYQVAPRNLRIFRIPWLRVIKISFPRPVPQGSLRDRDIHAGQQHVPLASLPVPDGDGARQRRPSIRSAWRSGGAVLSPGSVVRGPAVFAERETSCVIGPDCTVTVNADRNLIIDLDQEGTR